MGGDFESLDFILFINPQSDHFKGVRNRIGIEIFGEIQCSFHHPLFLQVIDGYVRVGFFAVRVQLP